MSGAGRRTTSSRSGTTGRSGSAGRTESAGRSDKPTRRSVRKRSGRNRSAADKDRNRRASRTSMSALDPGSKGKRASRTSASLASAPRHSSPTRVRSSSKTKAQRNKSKAASGSIIASGGANVGDVWSDAVLTTPTIAIPDRFPLRLFFIDGRYIATTCYSSYTAGALIKHYWSKIQGHVSAKGPDGVALRLLRGVDEDIPSGLLLVHLVYVQERLKDKVSPMLAVVEAGTNNIVFRRSRRVSARVSYGQTAPLVSPRMSRRAAPPSINSASVKAEEEETRAMLKTSGMTVPLLFILGNLRMVMKCSPDSSIGQIKKEMYALAKKKSDDEIKALSHYHVKLPGEGGVLSNEKQKLKDVPQLAAALRGGIVKLTFVPRTGDGVDQREKELINKIGVLIGTPLSWTSEEEEISSFRYNMWSIRQREVEALKASRAHLVNLDLAVKNIALAERPSTFLIRVQDGSGSVTLKVEATMSVQDVVGVIRKDSKARKMVPSGVTSDTDCLLKVFGLSEYLGGSNYRIIDADYVRRCLSKQHPIVFSLAHRGTVVAAASDTKDLWMESPPPKPETSTPARYFDASRDALVHHFRLRVIGVEEIGLDIDEITMQCFVTAGVYHGGKLLGKLCQTRSVYCTSENPRWYEWLDFGIRVHDLPKAARVCFTLWGIEGKDKYALGWVNVQLVDHTRKLRAGYMALNMWENGEANPIGTCVSNVANANSAELFVEFEQYVLPVVFPRVSSSKPREKPTDAPSKDEFMALERVAKNDPLYEPSDADRALLWKYRYFVNTIPSALPKFLSIVRWDDRDEVVEAHRMLAIWAKMTPGEALQLLDSRFADESVREYAVQLLEDLSPTLLGDYLLQLVNVLKYEPYHDSPLARFLLRKALQHRLRIGHPLFWHLKAELHVPEVSERYGLLLEQYLRGCGGHRTILARQNEMLLGITEAADEIKVVSKEERKATLQYWLERVDFPKNGQAVQLPLDPGVEVTGLDVPQCKYFSSKKKPLLLVFNNADRIAKPVISMYKLGDDLRQDALTMQMLRIMDKLWQREGLDFRMSMYDVVSTGDEQGFIQIVTKSDTLAQIQATSGGVSGAYNTNVLASYLEKHNKGDDAYKKAVENFKLSTAGYCVATYVLGIGDRHNDNIMMTRDGHLFHIDFGHFLGNFKSKFGIKRERAPFVFTPDMAHVLGGKGSDEYNGFVKLCLQAYGIIRKHSHTFINLFALMLSTGIPELERPQDIEYLRDACVLDLDDKGAANHFMKKLEESLASQATLANFALHIVAHRKEYKK